MLLNVRDVLNKIICVGDIKLLVWYKLPHQSSQISDCNDALNLQKIIGQACTRSNLKFLDRSNVILPILSSQLNIALHTCIHTEKRRIYRDKETHASKLGCVIVQFKKCPLERTSINQCLPKILNKQTIYQYYQ